MSIDRRLIFLAILGTAASGAAQVVRVADSPLSSSIDFLHSDVSRAPAGSLGAAWTEVPSGDMHLATSSDGGASWTSRTGIAAFDVSRVKLQDPGIVDVLSAAPGRASHRRSTDGGFTWSGPHTSPIGVCTPLGCDVAVSSGGSIAIVELTPYPSLHVATSSDGGVTWPNDITVATGRFVLGQPSLSWLGPTDLLACWSEDPGSIRCARSSDGGASFASSVEAARLAPAELLYHRAAVRAPSEIILGVASATSLMFTRSSDGGASWSPLQTLATTTAPWSFSRPSVSASTSGEAWIAASSIHPDQPPDRTELWTSADGINWVSASPPPPLSACTLALEPQVLAGGPGELWYRNATRAWAVPAGSGSRTLDGAVTWDPPVSFGAAEAAYPPTQGVHVLRIASGRLVSLWIEGGVSLRLIASFSDDDGITWSSPPVQVSDTVVSSRAEDAREVFDGLIPFHYPRFDAVALQSGGLVIVWLEQGGSTYCEGARASSSADGSAFAASVALGDFDDFPLSIAEDGAQTLVSTWLAGGDLVSTRSIDGGLSWSLPAVVTSPSGGVPLLATEVATAGDGSLAVAVIRDQQGINLDDRTWSSDIELSSSTDGGLTWQIRFSRLQPRWRGYNPILVNAGPRLVLVWHHMSRGGFDLYVEPLSLESTDSGQSFQWLTTNGFTGLWPRPNMIGDEFGNLYWTQPYDAVLRHRPGDPGREILAWIPASSYEVAWNVDPSLLVTNTQLTALFPDWSETVRPPAGVFYVALPCSCLVSSAPPAAVTSCNGAPVTLSIAAAPNARYQWYDSTGPIPGATAPDLTLSGPLDGERIRAWVSNECPGLWGSDTLVTIADPPSVIDAPGATTVCEGTPLQLAVTATDATSYQWSKDGVPIPGAIAATYDVATAAASDAGVYIVEATGPCGAVTSPPAMVAVETLLGPISSNLYLVRDGADLRFHWNDVAVARSYEVREDAAPAGSFASVAGTALHGWPGVAIPFTPATVYFRLAGVNSCGSGSP